MKTYENSQCLRIIFRPVSIVERLVVCTNKHFSCSDVGWRVSKMIFSRSASKNNLNKWRTTHIHINVHQSHNIVKTNNQRVFKKEKTNIKKKRKSRKMKKTKAITKKEKKRSTQTKTRKKKKEKQCKGIIQDIHNSMWRSTIYAY